MQAPDSVIGEVDQQTSAKLRGRVLIVEDDQYFLSQIIRLLATCSYEVIATTRLDQVPGGGFDMVIAEAHLVLQQGKLNDALAGSDGKQQPTILLTSRDSKIDREARSLISPATVLARPFHNNDLINALEVQMGSHGRHSSVGTGSEDRVMTFGDISVDLHTRTTVISGNPIDLTPREFDLLAFLVSRDGALCTRSLLLDRVWGIRESVSSRTLDVHVRWLRGKIELDPSRPVRLLTVRSIGYRLVRHLADKDSKA